MLAEEFLTSSEKFHIELGLKRILRILELLGNPQNGLNIIHIAGSNGKGSTCAILEEIFVQAGFKTGKFTSPHLFSYTERIAVNKRPISDTEFNDIIEKIALLDKEYGIELTEFEILTAAGFLYFREKHCDIVLLEVGLGGRLDSTNVIENPIASIVTSVSLEHKERLGDTIEKIAYEKAGIFKKACPAIVLKQNKGYETLKNEAAKKDAIFYDTETVDMNDGCVCINGEAVEFGLCGRHQGENLALALKAVDIVNKNGTLNRNVGFETVKRALPKVKWRFRLESFEYNGSKILVDACHNPDGARVLAEYLNENHKGRRIKFIFGCLKNKDYKAVLGQLFNLDELSNKRQKTDRELCFYEFNYPNALKYREFAAELPVEIKNITRKIENPKKEMARGGADLTVVCGSIYMLGELFKDFEP